MLLINSEIMKIVLDIKELKTIQENNEKLLKEINDKYNTEISDYNFKLSEHNKKVSAINTYNQSIVKHNKLQIEYTNQIKLINEIDCSNNLDIMDCDYDNDLYEKCIIGLENEPERGNRCMVCYNLRMEKTAKMAKECNYDYFCTTLSVSPYKNALWINEIGRELEDKYKVKWLYSDFKKKDGYKKSILLSQKYNLYRQNYCGCIYSKPQ